MGFSRQEYWSGVPLPSPRKTSTSALLTTPKPLTVWITRLWKILKEMGYQTHLTCLLSNLYAGQETTVRIKHGTMDASKLEKEYNEVAYCHPVDLTYMKFTLCKMPDWMKHTLESRLQRNISNLRYAHDITLMAESEEEEPLGESEVESEKPGLKLNFQKTKIMASGTNTSWQI